MRRGSITAIDVNAGGTSRATYVIVTKSEANVAHDRELINPHGDDKRYVRRNDQGEFTD